MPDEFAQVPSMTHVMLPAAIVVLIAWIGMLTRQLSQSLETQARRPSELSSGDAGPLSNGFVKAKSWDSTTPLGMSRTDMDPALIEVQLATLCRARSVSKDNEQVRKTTEDVIDFSFQVDEHASFELSLAFTKTGELHFVERAHNFPLGFLPWLAFVKEFDLAHSLLPPIVRSVVERLGISHKFAVNDQLYFYRSRRFGPIPGIESYIATTLFDVADEPEDPAGAVLVRVEGPSTPSSNDTRNCFRGVTLDAPPPGYERTQDISIVGYIAPSTTLPGPCGRIDFRVLGKVRLPVSRWMLPNVLLRWFIPFVLRLFCRLCDALTCGFERTALCQRVAEDREGFYAAVVARLPALYHGHIPCSGWKLVGTRHATRSRTF